MKAGKTILLAFVLLGFSRVASAEATLVAGLGGTPGFGVDTLAAGDDTSSVAIDLGTAFPDGLHYYALTQSTVYVNTNGNVSFGAPLSPYTPSPFPVATQPIIAPWWGDVDTRGTATAGENAVYWNVSPGRLVATWFRVGYYNAHVDRRAAFQLILTDASASASPGDFDVEFRYNRCEWTTGDASGGSGGLGGTPAQAGFDAGTVTAHYALPGSYTAAVLDLCTTSNVGDSGVWRFPIRSGVVGVCGDGAQQGGEGCDDGNGTDGDGCAACQVEAGWDCSGEPSTCVALPAACGDGGIDDGEQCDDGDTANGDGCSGTCQVEAGWSCAGQPSVCDESPAVCGDGALAAGEECDDGNATSGDGCDPTCVVEPNWACAGEPSTCSAIDGGDGSGGGCSAGGSPAGPLLLLGVCAMMWARRRRPRG